MNVSVLVAKTLASTKQLFQLAKSGCIDARHDCIVGSPNTLFGYTKTFVLVAAAAISHHISLIAYLKNDVRN